MDRTLQLEIREICPTTSIDAQNMDYGLENSRRLHGSQQNQQHSYYNKFHNEICKSSSNFITLLYISIDRDVQLRILFIYDRFMFESMSMV